MKRLLAVLAALLGAWLGATTTAIAAVPSAPVVTCVYDGHHHSAPVNCTITERGSPATSGRHSTTYNAVDPWSHGPSAPPQLATSPPAYTYNHPAPLVQVAGDARTTEGPGHATLAALSSGAIGGVAAETATGVVSRSLPELRAAADATIPQGVSRAEWGAQVWGTGPNAEAAARGLIGRTPDALDKIPGLTVDTATKWRDFYQAAAGASRGAGTAQARVDLMNDIIRTLGGTP